jgi:hypothetical protein
MRHLAPILLALVTPTLAAPASDAELCRSQLELLLSGNKLTDTEAATFQAQCDCLEETPDAECAEARAS